MSSKSVFVNALYEQIIGEAFKPESKTEAETFELIRDNLNTLGIH